MNIYNEYNVNIPKTPISPTEDAKSGWVWWGECVRVC